MLSNSTTTVLSMLIVAVFGKSLNKENNFDAICRESQDGYAVFVPHPFDCGLYYECVGLTPVLMSCPTGLYFDSRIDICNWPEYVDCEITTTTTISTTSTSTTPSSTTTTHSSTTSTSTTPSSTTTTPSSTTSTSTTPSPTTTTPSSTTSTSTTPFFNTTTPSSTTSTSTTPSPTTTTPSSTTSTSTTPFFNTTTPSSTTSTSTTPSPTTTTPSSTTSTSTTPSSTSTNVSKSTTMSSSTTSIFTTVTSLVTNTTAEIGPSSNSTEGPTTPPVTEETNNSTSAVTTTTDQNSWGSTKAKRSTPGFDAICHESQDGYAVFVPHPFDCGLYYECDGLTPVLMSCPTGLYFDTKLNTCNWPEYVDCDEHEETTTTETTTTTTTQDFDAICHESLDGYAVFVPHPFDCSLYYECDGLTPVLMSCPTGLFFDSRIDICNWPEYVDCEEKRLKY